MPWNIQRYDRSGTAPWKPYRGSQPTSWHRPSGFDRHGSPYVRQCYVQQIMVGFVTTYIIPRVPSVNNEVSEAASSLMHLQANNGQRVKSLIARETLGTLKHKQHVDFSATAILKRKHWPRTCPVLTSLRDEPPAVGASGLISAVRQNSIRIWTLQHHIFDSQPLSLVNWAL